VLMDVCDLPMVPEAVACRLDKWGLILINDNVSCSL